MSRRTPAVVGAVLVWLVLAIGPGLLVASGAIGSIDADGGVTGTVFGTWVLGFVLSYGWLFVVDKAIGRSHHWWLVTGSFLPWLVDLSLAFSPRPGWLFIGITLANGVAMAFDALRAGWMERGTPATATVVQVLPSFLHLNYVVNDVYLHRRLLVDVARPDGTHTRQRLGILSEIGGTPGVGDTLPVLVDPAHPDRLALAPTTS